MHCNSFLQIVVMAGGANDFVLGPISLEEWSATYLDFLQAVSTDCQRRFMLGTFSSYCSRICVA